MNAIEIKEFRIKRGLSQERMAHLVGVSYITISRWERDKSKPSPLALEKIRSIADRKEKAL
jgi:putative transcriptional regulator